MGELTSRRRLAENVRIMRLFRCWSQEDLAEAAGLDRSYIGALERAERNVGLDSLERLAQAFGVEIAELIREPDAEAIGRQFLKLIRDMVQNGKTLRLKEAAAIYGSPGEPLRVYLSESAFASWRRSTGMTSVVFTASA